MRERLGKLARFGAVGLSCLGLGLAILVGLQALAGVNYLIAYVVSFLVTNVAGYLLNARFTFSLKSAEHSGVLRYMMVNAALLTANTVALKYLVDVMHLWYVLGALLLAAVNTPLSFAGQWLFTYRSQTRSHAAAA